MNNIAFLPLFKITKKQYLTISLIKPYNVLKSISFLEDIGMYFISDWALLNNANSKQLRRILRLHHQSEPEIHLACILLESYHAVYRRDRLKQRRNRLKFVQGERCLPPTSAQLDEILQQINVKSTLRLSTQEVLDSLQNLANTLEQYCLDFKKGLKKQASLNGENPQEAICGDRLYTVLLDTD